MSSILARDCCVASESDVDFCNVSCAVNSELEAFCNNRCIRSSVRKAQVLYDPG